MAHYTLGNKSLGWRKDGDNMQWCLELARRYIQASKLVSVAEFSDVWLIFRELFRHFSVKTNFTAEFKIKAESS